MLRRLGHWRDQIAIRSTACSSRKPPSRSWRSFRMSSNSTVTASSAFGELHRPAGGEGGGEGAFVEVVEFAADGDAVGEARHGDRQRGDEVGDVVGGGLA